jgi:hypothetical protein
MQAWFDEGLDSGFLLGFSLQRTVHKVPGAGNDQLVDLFAHIRGKGWKLTSQ